MTLSLTCWAAGAQKALAVKAAFLREAGLEVSVCGTEAGV